MAVGNGEALLSVEGLCKSYPSGEARLQVLDGVDLILRRGETLAVTGASGSGKSTLLHLVGGMETADSGSIRFAGLEVSGLDASQRASYRNREIGFVFQFHHLLPEFSALENVMMPGLLRGTDFASMRRRARGILEEVGLAERLHHRVGKLSGGERQRVAVARALVLDPPLILADEPTGNLDPATGERVGDLLLEMNRSRGTALVVVTHNERLAARLGQIATLEEGRVAGGKAHVEAPASA